MCPPAPRGSCLHDLIRGVRARAPAPQEHPQQLGQREHACFVVGVGLLRGVCRPLHWIFCRSLCSFFLMCGRRATHRRRARCRGGVDEATSGAPEGSKGGWGGGRSTDGLFGGGAEQSLAVAQELLGPLGHDPSAGLCIFVDSCSNSCINSSHNAVGRGGQKSTTHESIGINSKKY